MKNDLTLILYRIVGYFDFMRGGKHFAFQNTNKSRQRDALMFCFFKQTQFKIVLKTSAMINSCHLLTNFSTNKLNKFSSKN